MSPVFSLSWLIPRVVTALCVSAGFLPTSGTSCTAPASAWWTRTCGSSSGWSSTPPAPCPRRRSCWRLWPAPTTPSSSTGTSGPHSPRTSLIDHSERFTLTSHVSHTHTPTHTQTHTHRHTQWQWLRQQQRTLCCPGTFSSFCRFSLSSFLVHLRIICCCKGKKNEFAFSHYGSWSTLFSLRAKRSACAHQGGYTEPPAGGEAAGQHRKRLIKNKYWII